MIQQISPHNIERLLIDDDEDVLQAGEEQFKECPLHVQKDILNNLNKKKQGYFFFEHNDKLVRIVWI
jgi:hypothetical protein